VVEAGAIGKPGEIVVHGHERFEPPNGCAR
jgi:hypothetical protein